MGIWSMTWFLSAIGGFVAGAWPSCLACPGRSRPAVFPVADLQPCCSSHQANCAARLRHPVKQRQRPVRGLNRSRAGPAAMPQRTLPGWLNLRRALARYAQAVVL